VSLFIWQWKMTFCDNSERGFGWVDFAFKFARHVALFRRTTVALLGQKGILLLGIRWKTRSLEVPKNALHFFALRLNVQPATGICRTTDGTCDACVFSPDILNRFALL